MTSSITPSYTSIPFVHLQKEEIRVDFLQPDVVSFPKTVAELDAGFHTVECSVVETLRQITALRERTFENTVMAYDHALAYFQTFGSAVQVVQMVHPDEGMRKRAEEILIRWSEMKVDLFETNREIYRAFKECRGELEGERLYYFTNALISFQRAGLELDESGFQEMKELQKQIAALSIQYHANLASDCSSLQLEVTLPCDYPTYFQVMTNCTVESTRKNYLRVFNNRASQNLEVLNQIIACRGRLARLLGYDSYAAFDIAQEMAQTVENVEKFLDDLSQKTAPQIKANWEAIHQGQIEPWNVAFVAGQYLKTHFNIDQEKIAEHFPMESTVRGLLDIYEQFFNLKLQVVENEGLWDPSVQTIEVRNQSLVGYVLLDLFPRKNKYSHCCCKSITPTLAVVIANFSKSARLKHHEVKTFFHEFGHAIHALFGKSEMPTKAGYHTKTDFVEAPSQLLEEWMWDRDILKRISRHYQTGNSLPDSVIDDLIKTRNLTDAAHPTTAGNSDHAGTELLFARLALKLYKNEGDLEEIYRTTPQIVAYDPNYVNLCAFVHLIEYGAKYYSYPWSKQLALQIFDYIKANGGLLDPKMGERYIAKIIGRGGSCDPGELIRDFLNTR